MLTFQLFVIALFADNYISAINSTDTVLDNTAEPVVLEFARLINHDVGQILDLQCQVKGHSVLITWYKDNHQINLMKNDTRFIMMPLNGHRNAHLRITNLKKTDSGTYRCQAQSVVSNSTDSKSVEVRVTDFEAAVQTFMALAAEVLILCVIIFLQERHGKNKMKKPWRFQKMSRGKKYKKHVLLNM